MKRQLKTVLVTALVLVVGSVQAETINGVNIDFVNINSGSSDVSTGYGGVGYNYRIGTTEISFNQFSPSGLGSSGSGDNPAANMTWHVAAQYANWLTSSNVNVGAYTLSAGKVTAIDRSYRNEAGQLYVLPSEDEWYRAAYFTGSGYSDYANGTSLLPLAGTAANYDDALSSAWAVGGGTVEQNGTVNMMGNVFEWLETSVGGDSTVDGSDMVLRGGAYNIPGNRLFRGYRVDGIGEDTLTNNQSDISVGMRIVAIPEPGTISLMSLSTISLFLTRTIRRRKLLGKSLLPVGREYSCDMFGPIEYVEDMAYLEEGQQVIKAWLLEGWGSVHARYKVLDKMFWNRMVRLDARKKAVQKTFKALAKKKVLSGFDAFLALIMK